MTLFWSLFAKLFRKKEPRVLGLCSKLSHNVYGHIKIFVFSNYTSIIATYCKFTMALLRLLYPTSSTGHSVTFQGECALRLTRSSLESFM